MCFYPIFFRFLINEWNVNSRVHKKLPRTNNPVEGLFNAINNSIGKVNPTLWKLIRAFQSEESGARLKMNQVSRGDTVKQSKVYKDVNERLQNMVQDYEHDGKKDRMKFLFFASMVLKNMEVIEVENMEPQDE